MAKQGKTLVQLAQEIQDQAASKRDFAAPVASLSTSVETVNQAPQVVMNLRGQGSFPITDHAHGQMAGYLGIPKPYYDRMLVNAPELLTSSINRWMKDHESDKRPTRFIRTLRGQVRAILSDGYRPLDYADLAEAVLPVLSQMNLMILSCEITTTRMYIKAVDKSIEKDLPEGFSMGDGSHKIFDTISPAITIGDSEVGNGSLFIESGVWTRACTNLASFGASMRKYHTGTRAELSEEVYELLTTQTKTATDRALWMQTRDLVKAAFDEAKFEATRQKLITAHNDKFEATTLEVVERTAERFAFTETEKSSVLEHLIKGGDLSRYGLHAAITRTAEDLPDYERATEFEKLGGVVIELPKNDWQVINERKAA